MILEAVTLWLNDRPDRFFVAAGQAGLKQQTFRRLGQPGDLARQILRMLDGIARDRTFVPGLSSACAGKTAPVIGGSGRRAR